ncbi:GNAT family N-acetyltransferase [Macrococcus epidermidis]|uniref:GNAT family N-acetyltransferase n=1 Tax=Macrococcus epidermidis TaxID=1902580 RepID=A0A327ZV28_9STAP|nr:MULTISPECIES: GNAT family N-acetyltransferase [Macrococcus]MCG7419522.1 GNAT family N-acetyltransferase [Macrococcus epidermidis]MCH4985251.1 GNAT family N-acetyltransferase [Macrococcus sp. PK]RAK46055.1 GNAT family N-acetyltransferase [Macrococcus epidermidis]UTH16851.1 GNAT family N-acetyltransferase [Macrococcus epidermidis]
MRKLSLTETNKIKEIAALHENIPLAYDSSYKVTPLDIDLRYESIQLLMKHKHDQITVIEHNNKICAYIWYAIDGAIHIKSTFVYPKYRNQGYAIQLKYYVETIAKEQHIGIIYSDVDPKNFAMRQLNERLGYQFKEHSNRMIKIIEVQND